MKAFTGLMWAILFCFTVWIVLVVAHDYGRAKFIQGYSEAMKNCTALRVLDTTKELTRRVYDNKQK